MERIYSNTAKDKIPEQLIEVGFDTLDFGSFVSPKAIPQLKDTTEVLSGLTLSNTSTKLLSIVANLQGVQSRQQASRKLLIWAFHFFLYQKNFKREIQIQLLKNP